MAQDGSAQTSGAERGVTRFKGFSDAVFAIALAPDRRDQGSGLSAGVPRIRRSERGDDRAVARASRPSALLRRDRRLPPPHDDAPLWPGGAGPDRRHSPYVRAEPRRCRHRADVRGVLPDAATVRRDWTGDGREASRMVEALQAANVTCSSHPRARLRPTGCVQTVRRRSCGKERCGIPLCAPLSRHLFPAAAHREGKASPLRA
jgi:hypothetical protein